MTCERLPGSAEKAIDRQPPRHVAEGASSEQIMWVALPISVLREAKQQIETLGGRILLAPVPPSAPPAASGTPRLQLRCFGPMEVLIDGQPIQKWPRRKAKALLGALALYPNGLSAATLMECLGHEDLTSNANCDFLVNLSALRRNLAPGIPSDHHPFLHFDGERYRLRPEALDTIDLHEFERCWSGAERLRQLDPVAAVALYEQALALYRGPLFDEAGLLRFFEFERTRLANQALDALLFIAEQARYRGEGEAEEAALSRAVALAPAEERAHEALLRFYRQHERPERLRQAYWDCKRMLKLYLGEGPSPAIEALLT